METAIPCTLMRGGSSKGLYIRAEHLPADENTRNALLLAMMGSPDERQIDGLGGAHPLTSKVAVVSVSDRADADIDYLFLQVVVDKAEVSDSQNCGNILAGVAPFAIEEGLVAAQADITQVRIHMVNTGSIAIASVETPNGKVNYIGDASIDGVPGTAAPVLIDFQDVAGSSCGALLPTGNVVDVVDGVEITCIDSGMPVVVLKAQDFGISGYESPDVLESNMQLKEKIESIRLQAGRLMNLGDVAKKTVPKMSLVAPAKNGGVLETRTFIPHRVHEAIGVLGAVSVATACVINGSIAQKTAAKEFAPGSHSLDIEHPTGRFTVEMSYHMNNDNISVDRSALLRTARKLMRGEAYVHREW